MYLTKLYALLTVCASYQNHYFSHKINKSFGLQHIKQ